MAGMALADLVANRTMSAEMAETLREAALARRSYLVIALPRLAGKSTVLQAVLDVARQDGAPVRELGVDGTDVAALAREARGGYLYVPEVSQQAVTEGYVWGPKVRQAFAAIAGGTALTASLHADSVEDAIEIIRRNDVPDADLARLEIVVHIRSLGEWEHPTRRVVAGVHELVGVSGGEARTRVLHRWDQARDRFEQVVSRGNF
ncbi:MAG TPA: hypothetical protein VFW12_07610 [Candidatus Limnocylindria bacterium]|nr:hypothetical protein [Candidatus Limnocylindria bacterium]